MANKNHLKEFDEGWTLP